MSKKHLGMETSKLARNVCVQFRIQKDSGPLKGGFGW